MSARIIIIWLVMFIISLVCYLLKLNNYGGIVTGYVNDFLSLPLLLIVLRTLLRYLRNDKSYNLPGSMIFAAFVYQSVLFEVVLPYFTSVYTSDVYDVIAYLAGALLFVLLQKISTE